MKNSTLHYSDYDGHTCSDCGGEWRHNLLDGGIDWPASLCDECRKKWKKIRLIQAGGTGEGRGRTPLDVDKEREVVIDFLKQANDLVGKKTIIEETGIAENKYIRVIKDLIAEGMLEQVGKKRGAKYKLVPEVEA